jgi:hypothetical protein
LSLSDLVSIRRPEAAAIGREDFVDEDDLIGVLVDAEFELGVGDDNAAFIGIVMCLRAGVSCELSNHPVRAKTQ